MSFKLPPEVRKQILSRVFGTTPERKALYEQSKSIIDQIANDDNVRRLYVAGSSATEKAAPNDIDLVAKVKDTSVYRNMNSTIGKKVNAPPDKDPHLVHFIPAQKLAQPKQDMEELVNAIMVEQGIGKKQAQIQAKGIKEYFDPVRGMLEVGKRKYGPDHKWVRIAGTGAAAGAAGGWLTSEADAAPPSSDDGWMTNEAGPPPTPEPATPMPSTFSLSDLVKKVIKAESNFDPKAISKAGAQGLMQLMPKTAEAMGVDDPFDPIQNVKGGTKYLNQQLTRFNGDVEMALAAYNAGPERVAKLVKRYPDNWKAMLPKETQQYISKITNAPAYSGPPIKSKAAIPLTASPIVSNQEGGWITSEPGAAPPPAAAQSPTLTPTPTSQDITAPPPPEPTFTPVGQEKVVPAEQEKGWLGSKLDLTKNPNLNPHENPSAPNPIPKELDLLDDLTLGTSAYITGALLTKLAGKNPMSKLGGVIAGAAATPIYVFSKGLLLGKPTEESVKDLPEEFFWYAGAGELAPYLLRGGKALAKGVMPGVDRMMHGPLQKVLKPFEPMGDQIWNTIIKPTQIQLPGIKKSAAEIFQSPVERMAKPGSKLENTAKTFRNIAVQKSHTRYLGDWMGKEMNRLTPMERYEVSRGLRGESYDTLSPKAKDLLERFDSGMTDARLSTRYENSFREEWSKMLQSSFGATEADISESSIKRLGTLFDKPLTQKAGTGGTVRVRDIHRALDDVISDPHASDKVKGFAKDLYDLPADTAEMVYQSSNRASMQLLQDKLISTPGIVSSKARDGYVKTTIGKMSGLYLPRDVDLELKALVEVPKISRGFYQKWFLGPWKTSKVIMRPATHIRNLVSNTILNDWGGLPFWRGDVYMKALAEMKRQGPIWKDFSARTGHYANYAKSDLANMEAGLRHGASVFDRAYSLFDRVVAPAGSLYSAEESWFKMAKYMHNLERGMTKSDAAFDAMKWTFNYAETTPEVAKIGKYAIPFVRWYSKAIPLMAETAVKHPLRFSKWIAFGAGLQRYSLNSTGVSDEEWQQMHSTLPDYIKNGVYLPMPWRNEKGQLNLMNLTYILPGIGDINEMYQRSIPELVLQNPMLTMAGTLLSKRKFSGAPLYQEWEEPTVKAAKSLSYIWESLSPAVVPGGTDWNSLYRAITDTEGTGPSIEESMAGWFGFKMTPVDQEANMRRSEAVKKIHEAEMAIQMQKELRKASNDNDVNAILERYQRIREGIAP